MDQPRDNAAVEGAPTPNSGARKKTEDLILKHISMADPSGFNTKRYREKFDAMNDREFATWMGEIRDRKRQLTMYAPNMKVNLRIDDLLATAKALGIELTERLRLWDHIGQRYYLTPHKYLVLTLPVRRLKQYLMDKMSVPESDKTLDLFTGQVVRPDKGSSISMTEMQTMMSKGLQKTITELTNVRGGNVHAYADFKASLEENGSVNLSELDPNTKVRSTVVGSVYLTANMLENNMAE